VDASIPVCNFCREGNIPTSLEQMVAAITL
jgi:hypothetical protein